MFNFTSDLMINVKAIDEQHKELFNRINALVSMGTKSVSREETEKTLNLLGEYIVKHFNDEEALQRKSNYPKYNWHREQHQHYMSQYRALKMEYAKNGPSVQFTLQINKSIIDWIVKHIKTADAEFGRFLNGNK